MIAEKVIFLDKKQGAGRVDEKTEEIEPSGEIEPSDLPF
jgi:hypothetical protein